MKTVVVTGAGGFLGRELVALLAGSGYRGVATGRRPPEGMPTGFEAAARDDVLDGRFSVAAVDAIVHLEVKHHVMNPDPRSVAEIDAVNIDGTRAWLEWASIRNIPRFVFASSVKAVRAEAGETLETAQPEVSDPYGRSKARAEDAVRGWAAADSRRGAVILRFAPVYGPGNTANLADFARQVLRGRPCFVGQGQTRKSVVSLRNATAAIGWALENSASGCDVYNVSDRAAHSIGELAAMIATAGGAPRPRGVPVPLARLGALAGDLAGLVFRRPAVLNSRRLAAMLETTVFPADNLVARGFVHLEETEEGIKDLVAWLTDVSKGSEIVGPSRTPA
jgi:nucleoside-diphosphate-sugar epimerase